MTACAACGFNAAATVLAAWDLHIPRDLGSLNARVFNGRNGWKYRADRDAWAEDFANLRAVLRIPLAEGKRRVTITRVYSGQQKVMDYANLVGGAKACTDAMKLAGLIVDDKPAFLEDHYHQVRAADRGVRVRIEEIEA